MLSGGGACDTPRSTPGTPGKSCPYGGCGPLFNLVLGKLGGFMGSTLPGFRGSGVIGKVWYLGWESGKNISFTNHQSGNGKSETMDETYRRI